MTPDALARVHAAAFHIPSPWAARDFEGFLADPACFLVVSSEADEVQAFALLRVAADEAELLTLATRPDARRRGLARAIVERGLIEAHRRGASACFLEVAADNVAACALYDAFGFVVQGRRLRYYQRPPDPPKDALVLRAGLETRLPLGHDPAPARIILY